MFGIDRSFKIFIFRKISGGRGQMLDLSSPPPLRRYPCITKQTLTAHRSIVSITQILRRENSVPNSFDFSDRMALAFFSFTLERA
jgi:hypothetical protein